MKNPANTAGASRSSYEPLVAGMRAFDRLPRKLRRALAECKFNLSPLQLAAVHRKHGVAVALKALELTEQRIEREGAA